MRPHLTKPLEVHQAVDAEKNVALVRMPDGQRQGIRSGAICRLGLAPKPGTAKRTLLVEVRGVPASFIEKYPAHCGPVARPELSIFMDEDTRTYLTVAHKHSYEFSIARAGMLGNMIYFCQWPQKYAKLLAWIGVVSAVLAILGWTLKDFLSGHSP